MLADMKFAFAPKSAIDLLSSDQLAKRSGFEFLEIPPTDVVDPNLMAEISAISSGFNLDQLSNHVATAGILKCPFVILPSRNLFTRDGTATPSTIIQLIQAGDSVAAFGGTLLLENDPSVRSALRLWHLLDRLNHPSIANCWNTLFAAQAGDEPAIAIPMLNSRIRYLRLIDGIRAERVINPCSIGEGNLPLKKTIDRLRGIGFDGVISVNTSHAPLEEEAELKTARAALAHWQLMPIEAAV